METKICSYCNKEISTQGYNDRYVDFGNGNYAHLKCRVDWEVSQPVQYTYNKEIGLNERIEPYDPLKVNQMEF